MQRAGVQRTGEISISILIPAYKESVALLRAVPRIRDCVKPHVSRLEIILVDDGSPDDTWACIEKLANEIVEVKGLRLSKNYGKDSALAAALDECNGDAAVILDADLQHPPEVIPEFIRLWREGYQIVEGVKANREKESFVRLKCSQLFNLIARKATRLDLKDSTDFKLISREVIDSLSRMHERRLFFRGMVGWVGYERAQVPFEVAEGTRAESNWSAWQLLKLSVRAIISFSALPLRFAFLVSVGFMVFGVLLAARAAQLWITGGAVSGITTVVILLLLQGGLILATLAVISEYLAAIYDEVKARPRYLVSQRVGRRSETVPAA